jgi:hypothetical protein
VLCPGSGSSRLGGSGGGSAGWVTVHGAALISPTARRPVRRPHPPRESKLPCGRRAVRAEKAGSAVTGARPPPNSPNIAETARGSTMPSRVILVGGNLVADSEFRKRLAGRDSAVEAQMVMEDLLPRWGRCNGAMVQWCMSPSPAGTPQAPRKTTTMHFWWRRTTCPRFGYLSPKGTCQGTALPFVGAPSLPPVTALHCTALRLA